MQPVLSAQPLSGLLCAGGEVSRCPLHLFGLLLFFPVLECAGAGCLTTVLISLTISYLIIVAFLDQIKVQHIISGSVDASVNL